MRSLLLPLGCAVLLGSCATFDSSAKVVLSSDPPGARVAIDDEDTGFVTPCILELDPEESAVLSFELLVPETSKRAVLWRQMYINSSAWHFPLWLNFRDFVVPVRVDKRLSPGRIFVRLERTADQ
jgi:hypothetical protein